MPYPLVCTNNTMGNIDYGTPIIASKSTDYRTSTGLYHRLIPNKPQEFDCRIKAKIKAKLLESDVRIKDDNIKSISNLEYVGKYPEPINYMRRASMLSNVNYMRTVQERVFKDPPLLKPPKVSEMKDSYQMKYVKFHTREVFPPDPYALCEVRGLGRDEQPAIRPSEKGYYKHLDPYLSINRMDYVPFSRDQQEGVAKKDIVTFYDAIYLPKVKGFGPQNCPSCEPLVSKRKIPMTDKTPFKRHPYSKSLRILPKRLQIGKTSETKAKFVPQTLSDLYPYLFQNGVDFPDSLSKSSAWQDLAPPGMYCTEYCHIGTGWPVRALIDYGQKEGIVHERCYTKFCDWFQ